jgi:hypothetical protein
MFMHKRLVFWGKAEAIGLRNASGVRISLEFLYHRGTGDRRAGSDDSTEQALFFSRKNIVIARRFCVKTRRNLVISRSSCVILRKNCVSGWLNLLWRRNKSASESRERGNPLKESLRGGFVVDFQILIGPSEKMRADDFFSPLRIHILVVSGAPRREL